MISPVESVGFNARTYSLPVSKEKSPSNSYSRNVFFLSVTSSHSNLSAASFSTLSIADAILISPPK